MIKILLCTVVFIIINRLAIAQVVYEPLGKDVYSYLQRLSQKGIIELDDLIKPFSKKYISDKLLEIKNKEGQLTELEKDELKYFEQDYYWELEGFQEANQDQKYLGYFERDLADRYRFFSYGDRIFKLNASPILGVSLSYPGKERILHSWMGISAYAYFLNNIGVSFRFKTNNEKGNKLDIRKEFTPVTGIIPDISDLGKDISYTEVTSSICVDWKWGNVAFVKDYIEYGYAKFGNLVLSDKAPSFPYIRLDLKPTDWFKFSYFHAWLSSTVIDSIKVSAYNRDVYREKFFAWHSLTLTPFKGFDVSIGESVVYADKLEPIYLMPFMFFYAADEYISNKHGKPGDANQQIFLTLSSKNHLMNTHLYGTLFIDELTIGGINGSLFINTTYGVATERRQRTQLGYTIGLSVTDLPIENLTLTSEYTRINPFVYGHHDPAQVYKNSNYLMGHWMGHNADLIYIDLTYRFFRGLQTNIWGSLIRKGSSDYSKQYERPEPSFLFGLRSSYKYFGFNLKYELLHELNFEARYKYTETSIEQSSGSNKNKHVNELGLSAYYGF